MSYTMNWKGAGYMLVFSGAISLGELGEAKSFWLNADSVGESQYYILDFSAADLSDIALEDVKHLAATDRVVNQTITALKVGLIVCDRYTESLCKIYIQLSKKFGTTWDIRSFSAIEDVAVWLGAKVDDISLMSS